MKDRWKKQSRIRAIRVTKIQFSVNLSSVFG
jgi:hypothetical protein